MKKRLLLAGLLFGTMLSASAQQNISFETSEGYAPGAINGQNEWTANTTDVAATVTADQATQGANSFMLSGTSAAEHTLVGAFSPEFAVGGDIISFGFDIKTTAFTETGSDFYISAQSPSQELLSSRIVFTFDGSIVVLDYTDPADPETLDYRVLDATYEGDTWYNVKMVMNNTANTIEYYLNNTLIHTGAKFGATNVEQIVLLNDNYAGSAYFDNVQVTEGLLSNKSVAAATNFTVYPNPANNVVNVGGTDALVNNVSIVDLNGRTVKTAKFNGVANAEVNVSDLSAGVYMMNVTSDKGTATKKIVKN